MPDEWFNTICWSSLLLGIFIIKRVVLSLTSFGTLKNDCTIKTIEMFNLLPLINSSVTIKFIFLLLIISYHQSYHQILLILYLFDMDGILPNL